MASTREGLETTRRKLTTYGKTSSKRPRSTFLLNDARLNGDLSIRSSQSASRTAKPQISSNASPSVQNPGEVVDGDDGRVAKKRKTPPARESVPASSRRNPSLESSNTMRNIHTDAITSIPSRQTSDLNRKGGPSMVAVRKPPQEDSSGGATPIPAKATTPRRPQLTEYDTKRPPILTRKSILPSRSIPPDSRQEKPETVAPKSTKVRLIDQLAAQEAESSESEMEPEADSQSSVDKKPRSQPELLTLNDTPSTPRKSGDQTSKSGSQSAQSLKRRKLRATYGQQRTIREDIDENAGGIGERDLADSGPSQHGLTPPAKLAKFDSFAFDEEEFDEETRPKGGILGLHALRQAGANHRFADELSDLFERIGSPQPGQNQLGRARRSALLELGRKLHDKKFVIRFSSYGSKETLFRGIGAENDVINGFILQSALLVLLANSSAPHLLDQLHDDGIPELFASQLKLDDDISSISREKSSNLSRNGRTSLSVLRSALMQLEVWDAKPPTQLSPKTIALKVLALSCRNVSMASRKIIERLEPQLFTVVAEGHDRPQSENDHDEDISKNVAMVLSLLQDHSIAAMESESRTRWNTEYLPLVAPILSTILDLPLAQFGDIGSSALHLALNTTNNNAASAVVFGTGALVRKLANASLACFKELQASVERGRFSTEVHGTLVLLLGVLINVSEHCPLTPESLGDEFNRETSPLDTLISVYLENHELSGSADSVEQTSLAVTYGYLAILLGYLCLNSAFRQRMEAKSQGEGIKYLLTSIREFLALHEKAAMDDMTTSLQGLINDLQLMAKTSG
ncbi:hypothetical protein SODALDRAFT_356916 [Sodiomyces alkalinus F11]|uniref:Wings apart-like protein C-terminal domain-containing protein n=1 Tax=Sodiomyces alkalinus (strain CBS 110278 / VKM F-3762 / F11) TaxID=1314773 RepID=A0A3N2Q2F1_SODAK|nr:hypothetical protein SODALDRAFT_356916 [Sodiomyces alkalinus F11]ROT40896.1 hypothetical protein SODALDRAFT_356916 [Sodiomyces alkalinus F11]